jgi:hypothetical protein
MKLNLWVWIGIAGVAVVAVGASLLKHFAEETEMANQQNIDKWVDKMLSESLSRKLNQPSKSILRELSASADVELTNSIQNTVRTVELTFTRQSLVSKVQVQLNASYNDGTSFSAATEKDWDELPRVIREQFLRTGEQVVRRPWNLSVVNADIA